MLQCARGFRFGWGGACRFCESASGMPRKSSSAGKARASVVSSRRWRTFSSSTLTFLQYRRVGTIPSCGTGFVCTWHAARAAEVAGEHTPMRTGPSRLMNASSPCWRTMVRSSIVSTCAARHAAAWKAKPAPEFPSDTGGSCRKSPQKRSCIPPNVRGSPRTARAMASSASKRFESSIDTSSMMSTRALRHRALAAPLASTFSISLATPPLPRPMPAHEWIVTPCTCDAAMPVGAVTATSPDIRASSCWIRKRNKKDLPVPAAPVRKALAPPSTRSAAMRCSSLSAPRSTLAMGGSGRGGAAGAAAAAAEDEPPPPNAEGILRFMDGTLFGTDKATGW